MLSNKSHFTCKHTLRLNVKNRERYIMLCLCMLERVNAEKEKVPSCHGSSDGLHTALTKGGTALFFLMVTDRLRCSVP